MDGSKGFPCAAKIHDVRGGEVYIDPHAAIPAAPHMQPQSLRRVKLHLPSEWSRETETTVHSPVQPDDELAGLVSDVSLHWGRGRWRRRGRCAAPSSSSPSATAASASPPPPSSHGRLRRHELLGRRGTLSSRDPHRRHRSADAPSRHSRRKEGAKVEGDE